MKFAPLTAIITAAVIMLSASTLQAQSEDDHDRKGKRGHHRGDPVAHLTKKLDLTDEQAVEVATIFEASRAQHRAIQESVEDEHCAVHEATMDELASVLSDEQMADFEDLQSRHKSRGRQHGMPRFANCES